MKADPEIITLCIETLTRFSDIKIAVLFGSAAKNRLTAISDIDLAVAAKTPLTMSEKTELHMALTESLTREIDLIDLQRIDGLLLQKVLCEGLVIKKESSELLAGLIKKMWYNQADMMPYVQMILKQHAHRFAHG